MELTYFLALAFVAWLAIFSYSLKFRQVARLLPKNTKHRVEIFWLKLGGILGIIYILIGLETQEIVWVILGILFLGIWALESIIK